MKRHESGYGMKIIMKSSATKKQLEIAKKIYPNAIVIKELEVPKVSFKKNDLMELLCIDSFISEFDNNMTGSFSSTSKNFYNEKAHLINESTILALAS